MEDKYKKNELFIAELRYLDSKEGIEYDSPLSYVLLNKKNNHYYNVFDVFEEYPVFERSKCYSNCTSDGVEYGTMMYYRGGVIQDGPCWVIGSAFPLQKDEFTKNELEDFIINDERFFKDRREVAPSRIKNPLKLLKLLNKDDAKYDYMVYYLQEREIQKCKKI